MLLVGIGLYIRLGILETPTFSRLVAENRVEKTPALEVIRRQPKEILLTALARTGEQAPFYIFTAFVFTYGTTILGVSRNLLLTAVLTAAVVSFFSIPYSGHLSDRIGRRRTYLLGAAATGVFGFVYFALLNTTRAGLDFPCHRTVADPARYDVRPASGVDRRVLYRPVALQRRFYRLSAGFGLCGRARAADCNGTVCSVQIGLCHRGLRLRLRPHQLRRRRPLAGLHEPGHLPGIRRKVVLRALEARAGRPG